VRPSLPRFPTNWASALTSEPHARADPGNGEVLGSLPEMTVADTKEAIQHAATALKSWRKTSEYERAAILQKIFQCVHAPSRSLARSGVKTDS